MMWRELAATAPSEIYASGVDDASQKRADTVFFEGTVK